MNSLAGVAVFVSGVLLLVGLHKLQGYLWRRNYKRRKFTGPEPPLDNGRDKPESP